MTTTTQGGSGYDHRDKETNSDDTASATTGSNPAKPTQSAAVVDAETRTVVDKLTEAVAKIAEVSVNQTRQETTETKDLLQQLVTIMAKEKTAGPSEAAAIPSEAAPPRPAATDKKSGPVTPESGNISKTTKDRTPLRSAIKLGKFNGTGCIDTFLTHFDNAAE